MSLTFREKLLRAAGLARTLRISDAPEDLIPDGRVDLFAVDYHTCESTRSATKGAVFDDSIHCVRSLDTTPWRCIQTARRLAKASRDCSERYFKADAFLEYPPPSAIVVATNQTNPSDKTLFVIIGDRDNLACDVGDDRLTTGRGQALHFQAVLPLLNCARAYAQQHGVSDIVLSGSRMGACMVDLFSQFLQDAWEKDGFQITLFSADSTGFAPYVATNVSLLLGDAVQLRAGAYEDTFGFLYGARSASHLSIQTIDTAKTYFESDHPFGGVEVLDCINSQIPGSRTIAGDDYHCDCIVRGELDRECSTCSTFGDLDITL